MKHLYHILTAAAATLLLCSCAAKYAKPAGFEVSIGDIRSTKAVLDIKPSTQDAFYMCGIVNGDMEEYFQMAPEELARFQLDFSIERWNLSEDHPASFTDIYCYKGNFHYKYTYLIPDMDYKVTVFQVNPDTKELVGMPVQKVFHTKPLDNSDIAFTFSFNTDKLTITPSNDDPYYWDYILTDVMDQEYSSAWQYFYDLIDNYEEYGFMELPGAVDTGVCEWVFSEDSEILKEGGKYTLVASGYNYGEINSDLTVAEFIYHKDKPSELIIPQE